MESTYVLDNFLDLCFILIQFIDVSNSTQDSENFTNHISSIVQVDLDPR